MTFLQKKLKILAIKQFKVLPQNISLNINLSQKPYLILPLP